MLDGLLPLGIVSFLVLLLLVIRQVWISKPYVGLLTALVLPCVMIAWPSPELAKIENLCCQIGRSP